MNIDPFDLLQFIFLLFLLYEKGKCYNKSRFVAHVIASHSLFGIKTKHAVLLASFTSKWRVWLVNFTTWPNILSTNSFCYVILFRMVVQL